MISEEKCAIAKRYVEYSNNHNIKAIQTLLDEQAIYTSHHVGKFHGRTDILTMMENYFTLFPDVHWQVEDYSSGLDGRVEFTYSLTATNANTGEKIERSGEERITVSPNGLIGYIEVLAA